MCLTMIDPVTSWFKIVELPVASVTCVRKGGEVVKEFVEGSYGGAVFDPQRLQPVDRRQIDDDGKVVGVDVLGDLCVVVQHVDQLDFHLLELLLGHTFDGVVLVQDSDLGPLAVDEGQLGGLSCDLSHTDVPRN